MIRIRTRPAPRPRPSAPLASTLASAIAAASALIPALAAPAGASGQGVEYVRANYTKYEFRIPARDGARLFTSVYVPKDADGSRTYPILLNRTPYGCRPYGADQYRDNLGPSPLFAESKYIFAYQDVRGAYMSEGEFVNMRPGASGGGTTRDVDESTDARDTIDWLTRNVPGNNGRVGVYGISYPGFYASNAMIDAHPAVKAVSPQAPICDWFAGDDFHHNGALFLPHAFNFLARFGRPRPEPTTRRDFAFDHGTPDGYAFFLKMGPLSNADARHFKGQVAFWNEMMAHPNYDDFWKARDIRPRLRDVRPAVLTVGGWFDAENLFGALETYKTVEANNPKSTNRLVMGPWSHGGWSRGPGSELGPVTFGSDTGETYRRTIEFPFFEHHLKGAPDPGLPEARVFETGRNQWRDYDTWPPRGTVARALHLHPGESLRFDAPPDGSGEDLCDEYASDPARPVPHLPRLDTAMGGDYMIQDQRHAARRPDVLVYETPPLTEDVTITGPIKVALHVSTSGTDSDWIVKLIDVYPNDYPDPDPNPTGIRMGGYQQMVRGDVFRGKFRNGLDKPEPFEPNRPTEVNFSMPDVHHTFRPGHRIMVQIHSTWFPLVDRNPQQFLDINAAKASDFRKATQRVYRSKERPSRLEVLTLPREPGPPPPPEAEPAPGPGPENGKTTAAPAPGANAAAAAAPGRRRAAARARARTRIRSRGRGIRG